MCLYTQIIFWGNSVLSHGIFKIQKRVIRLITNSGIKDSCRYLFKELKILPLYSQYLYSLLMFAAINRDLFKANTFIQSAQDINMISICHQHN